MHGASGELVQQPAVDRAECQLSALGAGLGPCDGIENEADLGGREIGVDHEAGSRADLILEPSRAQLLADRRGLPRLPDDGRMDRGAAGTVPHEGGLALVRDADRRHVPGGDAGLRKHAAGRAELALPDLLRIVFYPAGLPVVLGKLVLFDRGDGAAVVEEQRAGGGGALVQGHHVLAHRSSPTRDPAPQPKSASTNSCAEKSRRSSTPSPTPT